VTGFIPLPHLSISRWRDFVFQVQNETGDRFKTVRAATRVNTWM